MDQQDIDKVVAELRAKYPEPGYELVPLDLGRIGLFVLRNPTSQEHNFYMKQAIDEGQQAMASPNLFVSTCVYPEKPAVQQAMARWPGFVRRSSVQRAMAYLSGAAEVLEGKG